MIRSNHLEGNTITYGQTELLLIFGKVNGEGSFRDFNEMKASAVGLKMVDEKAHQHRMPKGVMKNCQRTS